MLYKCLADAHAAISRHINPGIGFLLVLQPCIIQSVIITINKHKAHRYCLIDAGGLAFIMNLIGSVVVDIRSI